MVSPAGFIMNLMIIIQLDHNQLHTLPSALLQLSTLRSLSASHNHLVAVAEQVSCLQHLQELSLHHNNLTALPNTIGTGTTLLPLQGECLKNVLTTCVFYRNNCWRYW
jgi:Leucine-rich repeat (LRR) protein